jgi:UDP-glucose 4-epimerase
MAAALGVANIMNNPIESISTNVLGSQVVLEAATKFEKRILIASTSEIYGKNPNQPLSEDDDRIVGTPQNYRWSYSDAKALEESMASALFFQKNLAVTTVRFFNTVGPKQTGSYGMVVPRFVESALKNEEILVHGTGQQSRVFCHVDDAVKAVYALSTNIKTIGQVYNVGGVGEITINELAEKIIALTQSRSSVRHVPYSEVYPHGFEDMQRRVPNISKIKAELGWSPSKSIDEIILDVAGSFKRI